MLSEMDNFLLIQTRFKAFPMVLPRQVAPLKKALDLGINLRPSTSLQNLQKIRNEAKTGDVHKSEIRTWPVFASFLIFCCIQRLLLGLKLILRSRAFFRGATCLGWSRGKALKTILKRREDVSVTPVTVYISRKYVHRQFLLRFSFSVASRGLYLILN